MAKKNSVAAKKAVAKKVAVKPARKPRFTPVAPNNTSPGARVGFVYNQPGHTEFSWLVTNTNGLHISMGIELFKNKKAALESLLEETKGVAGVYYAEPSSVFP